MRTRTADLAQSSDAQDFALRRTTAMEEYGEDERPPTGGARPSSARPSAAREPITAITQSLIESRAQQPAEAIYELNLHNCGLQSMVGLAACTKLRMLDLSFNSFLLNTVAPSEANDQAKERLTLLAESHAQKKKKKIRPAEILLCN